MNRLRRFPSLLPLAAFIGAALAAEPASFWRDDFEAARQEARRDHKDLLIDFTGSDWCAWCIRLHREVFDLPAFAKGIEPQFVAVELDYPKDPERVSAKIRSQNEALLKVYPVTAYPTVLLCDDTGRPYAATGYRPGGPEKFLAELETLRARKTARDQAMAAAAGQEGVAKAKTLVAALDGLQLDSAMIGAHYGEVIERIKQADPADETGFAGRQAQEALLADFVTKLGERRAAKDTDGALALIRETLANPQVRGELRQQVHGHHAGTLAYAGRKEEAIQVLEAAVKEDPAGPRTKELAEFIKILQKELATPKP